MTGRRFASLLDLFVLLLSAGTFATALAQGEDPGAVAYTANCSACHGVDGKGGGKAVAVATTLALMTISDAELTRILHEGASEGMPPFAQIGGANITAALRYLRTVEADTLQAATDRTTLMKDAPQVTHLPEVTQHDLLQKPVAANWVSYNGDYSGRRYSSLAQITPANVGRMAAQWVFHVREAGPLEVTPVVMAGVMFVTSANDVYALDARAGTPLWHHTRAVTQGLVDDAANHHNRGVAILGTHLYMETDNAHLLCLDARTGLLLWDVAYATGNKNYGATSAPLIVKDKVIVGTSGGDDGVRGFLAAFDAETGKEAWRFWTIPGPGEKGNESWPGDAFQHGGGTTWLPGTYDPALNTLYWGTGNPSPDYDGSVRPGDDLYTNCLLALDPDTGRLKWHFQYSPHDLYDYDAVQTPVLVDANFKGQPRKLVVTANRNGFLYVLDRTNGTLLLAKQFDRMQTWAKGIDATGRPISAGLIPDEQGVRVCPAAGGATNWYSPSYSPATHLFYFRSLEACGIFKAKTEPFEEGHSYYSTGMRLPTGENAQGYINAFDLEKLDFAWRDPQTGTNRGWGGVMSTATGLLAFGDDAQNFVVSNGRTGKTLWHFNLGQMVHASPMSYAVGGKQYFAIAAGTDLFSFALPK